MSPLLVVDPRNALTANPTLETNAVLVLWNIVEAKVAIANRMPRTDNRSAVEWRPSRSKRPSKLGIVQQWNRGW